MVGYDHISEGHSSELLACSGQDRGSLIVDICRWQIGLCYWGEEAAKRAGLLSEEGQRLSSSRNHIGNSARKTGNRHITKTLLLQDKEVQIKSKWQES